MPNPELGWFAGARGRDPYNQFKSLSWLSGTAEPDGPARPAEPAAESTKPVGAAEQDGHAESQGRDEAVESKTAKPDGTTEPGATEHDGPDVPNETNKPIERDGIAKPTGATKYDGPAEPHGPDEATESKTAEADEVAQPAGATDEPIEFNKTAEHDGTAKLTGPNEAVIGIILVTILVAVTLAFFGHRFKRRRSLTPSEHNGPDVTDETDSPPKPNGMAKLTAPIGTFLENVCETGLYRCLKRTRSPDPEMPTDSATEEEETSFLRSNASAGRPDLSLESL